LRAALAYCLMGLLPFSIDLEAGEYPAGLTDAEIKAGFIIKFKRYASWPQDVVTEDGPITIGVVGAPDIAQELERRVNRRAIAKRQVSVKRLQSGDPINDIHVLFIGNDRMSEFPDWLARTQGRSILLVTDSGNGMPAGSMINFVREDERIRFDVATKAAEPGRIKLSADLLTVARQVNR
jgi:hypothetical protein